MPKEQATTGRLPRPAAPGDPSPTGEGSVNAKSGPPYRPTLEWHTTDPDHWDKLKPEVQRMRGAPTDAEAVLWNALRRGGVGIHFRRQHVIDRFVVDFCSLAAKVVVEVDGAIHNNQEQRETNA